MGVPVRARTLMTLEPGQQDTVGGTVLRVRVAIPTSSSAQATSLEIEYVAPFFLLLVIGEREATTPNTPTPPEAYLLSVLRS
jgi:hypothetical protein